MRVELKERTADAVKIYFTRADNPIIKKYLPQKAKTVEEALEEFEKTKLPGTTSFGKTIWVDDIYVGDIWCYCISKEKEPNAMLSYCIFDVDLWGKGIATKAVNMFLEDIQLLYRINSIGAFTYASNDASIAVLQKNNFLVEEEFIEDGVKSVYLHKNFIINNKFDVEKKCGIV